MKTSFKSFVPVFIISIVLLMIIMFLPLFSVWGGTFNFEYGSSDETFFDVISFVFGGNKWMSYDMWVVQFTLAAIIPTILLFISASCKAKGMCVFSSIAGTAAMGFVFIRYCSDSDYNMEHLVGEYSSISIGAWLVLALFIIALILSVAIKTKKEGPALTASVQSTSSNANTVTVTNTSKG